MNWDVQKMPFSSTIEKIILKQSKKLSETYINIEETMALLKKILPSKYIEDSNSFFEYYILNFGKKKDVNLLYEYKFDKILVEKYKFQFFYYFILFLFNKSQKNNIQLFYINLVEKFRGKTITLTNIDRTFNKNISTNTYKNKRKQLMFKTIQNNKLIFKSYFGTYYVDNYVLVHIKKYSTLKIQKSLLENEEEKNDGRCTAIVFNRGSKLNSNIIKMKIV